MPAQGNLLTVLSRSRRAARARAGVASQLDGGDNQSLVDHVDTDLCDMSVAGLEPQYRLDHTYSAGVLAKSEWIDPCDGTAVVTIADHGIDAGTGLVATSRDPGGVATNFLYDAVGRLVSERPAASAWTHYRYHLATTSQPNLPLLLTVEQCANGLATCQEASLLGWERVL